MKSNLGHALKVVLGSESVNVSEFVQSAFGQLKPLYHNYLQKLPVPNGDKEHHTVSGRSLNPNSNQEQSLQEDRSSGSSGSKVDRQKQVSSPVTGADDAKVKSSVNELDPEKEGDSPVTHVDDAKENDSTNGGKPNKTIRSEENFWNTFAGSVDQSVLKKLGISLPEINFWEGFDLLNQMSIQSQKIAEEEYVQSGLATPLPAPEKEGEGSTSKLSPLNTALSSILDIRKASWDILSQTETILGGMMVLSANITQQKKDSDSESRLKDENKNYGMAETEDFAGRSLDNTKNIGAEVLPSVREEEERRKIFSSAESAMEAWTMLATSLGRNSFIKSEFVKICFLDNPSTDTQASSGNCSLCPIADHSGKGLSWEMGDLEFEDALRP